MPIRIQCSCGKRLRLRDDAAGRKVRCPDCEAILPVPLRQQRRARRSMPVATDAASGDGGEIDFGELAELERAADAAQDEFPVRCPKCACDFTAKASSRNAKATCPKCAARFRIGNHEADRFGLFDAAPPAWLNIALGRYSRRDQQRGKRFPADDPQWSVVLSGLNLMYVGLWIQAGTALFVLGSILAALLGLFVIILLGAGAAIGMQSVQEGARSGDFSTARGGGACAGFMIVLAGATICAFLRVALAMERFKEALLILPFIFVLAIIGAVTQGKVFIGLLVLWALVSVLAYPVVVVGWFRCAAIPAYTGGKHALVGSVVLLGFGMAASGVAALILLLKPPNLMGGATAPAVGLSANCAVFVMATSKGLFAYSLRRMVVFSDDAFVKGKVEMFLLLQVVFVLFAILGMAFALAGNQTTALYFTLFLKAVSVVDLLVFLDVVNTTRYLIQ